MYSYVLHVLISAEGPATSNATAGCGPSRRGPRRGSAAAAIGKGTSGVSYDNEYDHSNNITIMNSK